MTSALADTFLRFERSSTRHEPQRVHAILYQGNMRARWRAGSEGRVPTYRVPMVEGDGER